MRWLTARRAKTANTLLRIGFAVVAIWITVEVPSIGVSRLILLPIHAFLLGYGWRGALLGAERRSDAPRDNSKARR
jgi:hypothetical protein